MHKGQHLADLAAADLLMAAERHLPGREGNHHQPSLRETLRRAADELRLEGRLNVLYHVVQNHDIVAAAMLRKLAIQEGLAGEFPLKARLREEACGIVNLARGDVSAPHAAAPAGERQQITSLAAADFQHGNALHYGLELGDIGDEELLGSAGKFIEITTSVCIS